MRVESRGIDRQGLARLLKAEYGLEIATLNFVPKGEDSYSYLAETPAQGRYFVKVHPAERAADLEAKLRVAHRLRTRCDLPFVCHAHENRQGRLVCEFGTWAVAILDFLDGTTAFEQPLTEAEQDRVAVLLAALHAGARCPDLPSLDREDFRLPFTRRLSAVLEAAEDPAPAAHEHQLRARGLLLRHRADILATLETANRLGAFARQAAGDAVLTHGDPTSGNILRTEAGELFLLDWDLTALGPPERDLVYFTSGRFEPFLRSYLGAFGKPPRLSAEIFEYYEYWWAIQEITDFSSRILLEQLDHEENEHAWQELVQYVPVPHQAIAAAARRIEDVIRRVSAR